MSAPLEERLDRLLGNALTAMNEACLIAVEHGSPKAMEYIANWLNDGDGIDPDVADRIEAMLAGGTFPPDLVRS